MRVINNIFNAMKSSINQFRIDYRSEQVKKRNIYRNNN